MIPVYKNWNSPTFEPKSWWWERKGPRVLTLFSPLTIPIENHCLIMVQTRCNMPTFFTKIGKEMEHKNKLEGPWDHLAPPVPLIEILLNSSLKKSAATLYFH